MPDLIVWDVLRVLNTLVAIGVLVGSLYLLARPLVAVPEAVQHARTLLVVGMQCLLLGGIGGSLQRLGEPPTITLFGNLLGITVLVLWLAREHRAVGGAAP